jgi:hypothetical protein
MKQGIRQYARNLGLAAMVFILVYGILAFYCYCKLLPRCENEYLRNGGPTAGTRTRLHAMMIFTSPVVYLRLRSDWVYRCTEAVASRQREQPQWYRPRLPPPQQEWREVSFWPNGMKRDEVDYLGWQKHGWQRSWNEDGHLIFEARNCHDQRVGVTRRWYSTGQLQTEWHYVNNERDGRCIEYNTNGTVRFQCNWREGRPVDGSAETSFARGGTQEWYTTHFCRPTNRGPAAIEEYIEGWLVFSNGRLNHAIDSDRVPLDGYYWSMDTYDPYSTESSSVRELFYFFSSGVVWKVIDSNGREIPPMEGVGLLRYNKMW